MLLVTQLTQLVKHIRNLVTVYLVRAKSSGYTKQSDVAPAAPPEAKLPAKYRQNCVFLSTPPKKVCLYTSLNAKFNACVGKYLITLAKLPRQKLKKPCSLGIRTKQSIIPVTRNITENYKTMKNKTTVL